MTNREDVEEWIQDAPECIDISNVDIRRMEEPSYRVGKQTPVLVTGLFYLTIEASVDDWDTY